MNNYNSKLNNETTSFPVNAEGIKDYEEYMKDNKSEEVVDVIEKANTDYDNITYVMECVTCHSLYYINKDELIYDKELDVFNIDDECDVCTSKLGYEVIGKTRKETT